jgi:hypothetical protein
MAPRKDDVKRMSQSFLKKPSPADFSIGRTPRRLESHTGYTTLLSPLYMSILSGKLNAALLSNDCRNFLLRLLGCTVTCKSLPQVESWNPVCVSNSSCQSGWSNLCPEIPGSCAVLYWDIQITSTLYLFILASTHCRSISRKHSLSFFFLKSSKFLRKFS